MNQQREWMSSTGGIRQRFGDKGLQLSVGHLHFERLSVQRRQRGGETGVRTIVAAAERFQFALQLGEEVRGYGGGRGGHDSGFLVLLRQSEGDRFVGGFGVVLGLLSPQTVLRCLPFGSKVDGVQVIEDGEGEGEEGGWFLDWLFLRADFGSGNELFLDCNLVNHGHDLPLPIPHDLERFDECFLFLRATLQEDEGRVQLKVG